MTAYLFILAISLIVQKTFIPKALSFSGRPRTSVCNPALNIANRNKSWKLSPHFSLKCSQTFSRFTSFTRAINTKHALIWISTQGF